MKILCLFLKTIYLFSIHPRTKHDVGYRLSRAGLAVAYGQQVEFQGPIVQNVAYTSGGSTVEITYTGASSIELRNPNGFEVLIKISFSQYSNDFLFYFRYVVIELNVQMKIHGL